MMPQRKCSTVVTPDQLHQQQQHMMMAQRKCSTVVTPDQLRMQQMMPPPSSAHHQMQGQSGAQVSF